MLKKQDTFNGQLFSHSDDLHCNVESVKLEQTQLAPLPSTGKEGTPLNDYESKRHANCLFTLSQLKCIYVSFFSICFFFPSFRVSTRYKRSQQSVDHEAAKVAQMNTSNAIVNEYTELLRNLIAEVKQCKELILGLLTRGSSKKPDEPPQNTSANAELLNNVGALGQLGDAAIDKPVDDLNRKAHMATGSFGSFGSFGFNDKLNGKSKLGLAEPRLSSFVQVVAPNHTGTLNDFQPLRTRSIDKQANASLKHGRSPETHLSIRNDKRERRKAVLNRDKRSRKRSLKRSNRTTKQRTLTRSRGKKRGHKYNDYSDQSVLSDDQSDYYYESTTSDTEPIGDQHDDDDDDEHSQEDRSSSSEVDDEQHDDYRRRANKRARLSRYYRSPGDQKSEEVRNATNMFINKKDNNPFDLKDV